MYYSIKYCARAWLYRKKSMLYYMHRYIIIIYIIEKRFFFIYALYIYNEKKHDTFLNYERIFQQNIYNIIRYTNKMIYSINWKKMNFISLNLSEIYKMMKMKNNNCHYYSKIIRQYQTQWPTTVLFSFNVFTFIYYNPNSLAIFLPETFFCEPFQMWYVTHYWHRDTFVKQ